MCSEQRADSILQDGFAQLMLQKDVHPTKRFWQIQQQKTTQRPSNTKTFSLAQEVPEMQIRWNLERQWENLTLLLITHSILFLKYLSQALLGQWVLSWMELRLTGCAYPDAHGVPGLMWLVPLAFPTALIQNFMCFQAGRIYLSDRSTTPNEMCLEGVLWPMSISKLKFLTMGNL